MEEFLAEKIRAEDILLGSLGFGEDATIVSVVRANPGYQGIGRWKDGEIFEFQHDEPLDELEEWALEILTTLDKQKKEEAINP